jgi:hypothetical protein
MQKSNKKKTIFMYVFCYILIKQTSLYLLKPKKKSLVIFGCIICFLVKIRMNKVCNLHKFLLFTQVYISLIILLIVNERV